MEMHLVYKSNHLKNESVTKNQEHATMAVLGFFFKVPTEG
jgi:hypothetical protein